MDSIPPGYGPQPCGVHSSNTHNFIHIPAQRVVGRVANGFLATTEKMLYTNGVFCIQDQVITTEIK